MEQIGICFYIYIFAINVLAFALYAIDKRRAYYSLWRIPEFILLGLAVIGGAYGASAGMLLFRHKTQHRVFGITVPLCFVLWMILLIVICVYNAKTI